MAGPETFRLRIKRLRASMGDESYGALLVTSLINVRYLTGFTGSAGAVLVTGEDVFLLSDFRYRLQASREVQTAEFVEIEKTLGQSVAAVLGKSHSLLAVEAGHMTVFEWNRLAHRLDGIEIKQSEGLVEKLRVRKDEAELRKLRKAAALLDQVFDRLETMPVIGRREEDIALGLEFWARRSGSEPVPFSYIVAFGSNGAMPHATASTAEIERGGLLVVDVGAKVEGYCADMTRTFTTGGLTEEASTMYEVVRRAQEAGREAARPGVSAPKVDEAARAVIEEAGMGEYYGHGLGHGVGLEVHELPRIGVRSDDVLETGMTFTVEPGVYRPEVGGVRIEDTVALSSDGLEVLTSHPRALRTLS